MDGASGFRARAATYLDDTTRADTTDAGSRDKVWHAVAVLSRDPDADTPVELSVDDLATITERFATFTDTTDFDMVALLNLWYRSDHGKRLIADTRAHVKELILGFKYWYDEPQPAGIVDERWYWSENHQILFHAIELLAGPGVPRRHVHDQRHHRRRPRGAPRPPADRALGTRAGALRLQRVVLQRVLRGGPRGDGDAGRSWPTTATSRRSARSRPTSCSTTSPPTRSTGPSARPTAAATRKTR